MIFNVIKKAKQLLYDDSNTGLGVNNVQDAIDDLTQAIVEVDAVNEGSGESILLTDTLDDTVLDFKAYGKSVQDGEPTPDYPQAIKSVADGGYFDGELLQGAYNGTTGLAVENSYYIRNKNIIPCKPNDTIKLSYAEVKDKLRLFFYKADGTYISKSEVANKDIIEVTAPTNAYYFNFDIVQETIGLTPQNAKKIVVTINDKYALIVKSVSKNLFDISKIPNTANITNNQNGTLTITNSYSNNTYKKLSELTELKIGQTYTLSFSSTSEHQFIYLSTTSEKWENGMSLKMTQHRLDSAVYFYGNTSGVITISNIQIEENTVVTPYEPYKETVSYILLNEPLRSSLDGSVTDEVSLTEVNRRFKEEVFDGSSDELWSTYAPQESRPDGTYCYFVSVADNKKMEYNSSTCTHFNNKVSAWTIGDVGTFSDHNKNNYLYFVTDKSTFSEWKAWLQANPITVQYELAEPVVETIEPVDIVTYDNVTYITASDNAPMWVEYYSNSSVGQRLAKTDNKLAELDTVKELYNTPTVKARKCGKIIELTGTACTENELNQCLTALVNIGYAPDSITVLCMYNTGNSGDSSVGRLSMLGNFIVVSDMSNENFISNYNISFNAMWITG